MHCGGKARTSVWHHFILRWAQLTHSHARSIVTFFSDCYHVSSFAPEGKTTECLKKERILVGIEQTTWKTMTSNRGRLGGTSVAFRPMRRIQKCSLLATFKILSSNNLGHICGNNTSMISHRSVLDDSQKKSCSLLHYAVGFTPRVLTEVPTCKRERSEVQVIHSLIHSFVRSFVQYLSL